MGSKLFIAIDFPDDIRNEILTIQEKLKKLNLFTGNYVEFEKLHLTLKFIGNIEQEIVPKIINSLEQIKYEKFSVALDTIGLFARDNYPKILWVNLKDENNKLTELQKKIELSLDWLEQTKEKDKDFKNHLTIARIKSLKNKEKFLEQIYKITIPKTEFEVNEFKLKESQVVNSKILYGDLATFKMG